MTTKIYIATAGWYTLDGSDPTPPDPIPPDPVPPNPDDPLGLFNAIGARALALDSAADYVNWRWVMTNGPEQSAAQGALIAQMGQTAYNQRINDVSYNEPQAPLVQDRMYWLSSTWTGPPPTSVLEPGYLSVSAKP